MLKRIALSSALLILTALTFLPVAAQAQEKKVRVLIWGTTWQTAVKDISEKFTKETGIAVEPVFQTTGGESLVKLQAGRAKPMADVWFVGESVAARAAGDGELFALLPVASMKNLANVAPGAKKERYTAVYQYPLSIIYRPDMVTNPPATWQDLWNPRFKGAIAIPDIGVYQARMLLLASAVNGGSVDNVEPGFSSLKKLKPNISVIYGGDAQARQLLAKGEVSLLVAPPAQASRIASQGVEVKTVTPSPAIMNYDVVMILKNTGNEENSAKYVDFLLSKEANQALAEANNVAPVNKDATAPASIKAAIPANPQDLLSADEGKVNANFKDWSDRFKREIAN